MASKLLLLVVFVLDLIAFALAVAAEQRRTKVSFVFPKYFVGYLSKEKRKSILLVS
jgi:hypothetical protein